MQTPCKSLKPSTIPEAFQQPNSGLHLPPCTSQNDTNLAAILLFPFWSLLWNCRESHLLTDSPLPFRARAQASLLLLLEHFSKVALRQHRAPRDWAQPSQLKSQTAKQVTLSQKCGHHLQTFPEEAGATKEKKCHRNHNHGGGGTKTPNCDRVDMLPIPKSLS